MHKKHIERLSTPGLQNHFRTATGVDHDSVLNRLKYYHIITGTTASSYKLYILK